ncbi:hypothetical protein [Mycoplasmopsis gallinacea]|uniref:Uncharacterized protein n=1 Tax=Mycoplasmopsis gallinacea TaxID=29556 RepID=A0A6H0V2U1_9BACT|nr:hypothetical protein [Mycoplasmopsis gallinacea]QIW62009.1 hypothetical protein GOQ20_00805 [Mycoplasmopsis gallinacea]
MLLSYYCAKAKDFLYKNKLKTNGTKAGTIKIDSNNITSHRFGNMSSFFNKQTTIKKIKKPKNTKLHTKIIIKFVFLSSLKLAIFSSFTFNKKIPNVKRYNNLIFQELKEFISGILEIINIKTVKT